MPTETPNDNNELNNEPEIIIKGETEPVDADVQDGDKTSFAENNISVSHDKKPSADTEQQAKLEQQLLAKSRSEANLGSFSKKATKIVVKSALDGDDEAIDTIKNDRRYGEYVKKNFSEEYNEIFDEEEKVPELNMDDVVSNVKDSLREETQFDQISERIKNSGIKGIENYEKAMGYAKSLLKSGASIFAATDGAIASVKRNIPTQPALVGGNRNIMPQQKSSVEITKEAYQMARDFGVSDSQIKNSMSKYPSFFESDARAFHINNGVITPCDKK